MTFWQLAFNSGWISAEDLRQAVKTESNAFGEITPQEYDTITGIEF